MSAQFAHAPHRGSMATQQQQANHHPHAALLIDFDNVTMGIRSDLSKELKNLLSSDIIKGKVAVQRAYADWRRYPQYIVPLAESSVDLIFAPAYGSSKKNATDIRLAIDALELVFTRPEIGSFILLSGDSDFSSLVLKLKEYGKYVIGVGIRESASDLLVQNCDEYYSYSALTGLTRAGDEPRGSATSQDPWELVDVAVTQMADNNDVMRSDRLKQVMLEMDPTFDEKALGFQKFNRFMQDAAARGMVSLKKLENGQFEIGPAAPGARADAEEEEQRGNGQRARRSRRGGRGRGRDRSSEQHELPSMDTSADDAVAELVAEQGMNVDAETEPADFITAVTPVTEAAADAGLPRPVSLGGSMATSHTEDATEAATDTMSSEEIVAEVRDAEGAPSSRSRRGRGGRGRGRSNGEPAPIATGAELPPLETAARSRGDTTMLQDGYALLRKATKDVLARGGSSARDSDVKRRMLEIQSDWDEHPLGFSKFSRFLRQAHDAEVINLHKSDTGYDLTIGDGSGAPAKDAAPRTGKTGRHAAEATPHTAPQKTQSHSHAEEAAVASAAAASIEAPLDSQVTHAAPAKTQSASAPATQAPASPAAPAANAALGFRRGSSRGRPAGGMPPMLAGQMVASARAESATPESATPVAPAGPDASSSQAANGDDSQNNIDARDGRTATAKTGGRGAPAKAAAAAAPSPASNQFASLGFPTKAAEIATYLSEYKGVGPKSIQAVIDKFGAANVFDALQNKPDRVREVVTGARGETLLDAWNDDYSLRKAQSTPPEKQKAATAAPAKRGGAGKRPGPAARGPGRGAPARGGRGPAKGGRKPTKRA